MKKLLVLLMVLGMATMASAALQISVNGDPNPVDSMIEISPSDHLVLDIWTDAAIVKGTDDNFYWALVVDTTLGSIDYLSGVSLIADAGVMIEHGASAVNIGYPLPVGEDGTSGAIVLDALTSIAQGAVIFDLIDFHCENFGDAVIKLYTTPDGAELTLVDSVVIHQVIPEPMTMALLGLGGLFLRRRK